MGTITAYRDSSESHLVHIVPSGFNTGVNQPVNVKLKMTGYEEKILNFRVVDDAAVLPPEPPAIEVTPTSITSTYDVPGVLTVGGSGTIEATANPNSGISIDINQGERTVTLTSTAPYTGEVTITVDQSSVSIPVNFTALDVLTITTVPTGSTQYVGEPISITAEGTTKTVEASSTNEEFQISKTGEYSWTVDATAPVNSGRVYFRGTGVKETYKVFTFKERKQVSVDYPAELNGVYFVGETVAITFTGSSTVEQFNVVSSNPNITITKGQGEVWNLTSTEPGETTLTITGTDLKTIEESVRVRALQDITTTSDTFEASHTEEILITLGGVVGGDFQVETSNEAIVANPRGNTVIVTATGEITGTITVKGRGFNPKTINVVFDNREVTNKENLTVQVLNGSGTEELNSYVGDSYVIIIKNAPLDLKFLSANPKIHVSKTELNGDVRLYCDTYTDEGNELISGVITLTAEGYKRRDVSLTYQPLEVPVIENVNTKVTYLDTAVIEVTGLTKEPTVLTGDVAVKHTIEKSGSKYIIKLTTSKIVGTTVGITGTGILTKSTTVEFRDLYTMNAIVDRKSVDGTLYAGDEVVIDVRKEVQGEMVLVEGLEYTLEKAGDVSVTEDPSVKGRFKVICKTAGFAKIKFTAHGCKTLELSTITWLSGEVLYAIDVEDLGTRFVNETMTIKLLPDNLTNVKLSINGDFTVQKVLENLYTVTASEPVTGSITFSARGYIKVTKDLKFINPISVDLSTQQVSKHRGQTAVVNIPAIEVPYKVVCDNKDFEISETVLENGSKNISITSTKIGSGTINVIGRGITSKPATVSFIPEQVGSIVIEPGSYVDNCSYVNEEIIFKVVGVNIPYTVFVSTPNDDVVLEDLGSNRYKLTKPTAGIVNLTLSGAGVTSRQLNLVFLDVVVPTLGFNLSYDKFYVNEKPLLLVSKNVTTLFELTAVDAEGLDESITLTPYKVDPRVFEVSVSKALTATFTIRGRGIKETSISCIFENLAQPEVTFTPASKEGYVTKGVLVESDQDIRVSLVTQDPDVTITSTKEK